MARTVLEHVFERVRRAGVVHSPGAVVEDLHHRGVHGNADLRGHADP
jgi:hypothetical protein